MKSNSRTIVIPTTVEIDRFNFETKNQSEGRKYICYVGMLGGDKDGILNLIEAFAVAAVHIKQIDLVIGGDSKTPGTIDSLKDKCVQLHIEDRVIFTGLLAREDVPKIISNASLLVLARPDSKRAEGGFPSKVGEYLATGIPVLLTNTGEINYYIKDGVNGFLVPPDDNKIFANKIIEIFGNYANAQRVGREGRKLAEEVFDHRVQSERMFRFLNSIIQECD